MRERTRIGCQVYNLAATYGVSQVMVNDILQCYIRYCKDLLLAGIRVDFYGLVSLIPTPLYSDREVTMAYECYRVAEALNLPAVTVIAIVSAYIDDCISAIKRGVTAEIRGIVTMHPLRDVDGEITHVRASISTYFKNQIESQEVPVTRVRAHTYKYLRQQLKAGE